ncbi:hypothetical protein ASB57_09330 [Bordetella sp. N]|nr:hypothetical protein ASB57_09330 [Bordetella sp. N]
MLVICLLMTGILFSLRRGGLAGVSMCAWASAISCVGVAFNTSIPLNPVLPWLPFGLLGSTLFGLGIVLTWAGLRQFFGLSVPWVALSVLTVVYITVLTLRWYVWPDWAYRTATVSALRGLMSMAIAVLVWRYRPRNRAAFSYFFTIVMAVGLGLMHVWRSGVYFLGLDSINALAQASTIQNIYFSVGLVTLPGMTLGILMMIHDRLLGQGAKLAARGR